MTENSISQTLGSSEWFRDLPDEVVDLLAGFAQRRRLHDGERLFARGDDADGLYGVLAGRVRISTSASDGRELLINLFEPGGWFGEISMFDGLPRTHDAYAVGATELLLIPRDRFLGLLASQPALYPHFLRMLCLKLRRSFAWIEYEAFLPLPARLAARLLELPVETIGSRFGGIPQSLPALVWPEFHWASARNLVAPTITIALLGAIESLLCARVADSMIHDRHDPNQELMAQGLANLLTPLLAGIPATGTIARTTTNVRTGARTPIAGIIHCLTLLAVVLIAAPLAADVPLAALAAILVYVAWNMGEWRAFPRLAHFSNHYRLVMLSTFFLTVVFDLTIAVEVGMVLASLLFIYRVSDLTRLEPLALDPAQQGLPQRRVVAYSLFGSLFFGAVGKLELLMQDKHDQVAVVVLEMHQMINLDSTGLDTLETLHHSLHAEGRHLVLAGLNPQPLSLLRRSGFDKTLGEDKLAPDLAQALLRANQLARN